MQRYEEANLIESGATLDVSEFNIYHIATFDSEGRYVAGVIPEIGLVDPSSTAVTINGRYLRVSTRDQEAGDFEIRFGPLRAEFHFGE